MPTPEDNHYDRMADAQDAHDAMIDAVQNRGVDGSFPMDIDGEPTEAQLQPEGGWGGGFADNH